jgi:hypothetical protein
MNIDRRLKELLNVILDEVRQNPTFAERVTAVLGDAVGSRRGKTRERAEKSKSFEGAAPTREPKRGNRRASALVDPVREIEHGDHHLRDRLAALDLEQLRDVVAEYRMDPNKLVMKWKDRERVVDHILSTSISRAQG